MKVQEPGWTVSWVPEGFSPVRHTVMSDSEVILYSDGRSAFSVCIEAYGRRNVQEGVAQFGDEAALSKRVRNQFVTVVGDVPLMIADRIASSVDRNSR
jgi:negative regulator of sigma E activity